MSQSQPVGLMQRPAVRMVRRVLRWAAWGVLTVLLLAVLGTLYVTFVGVTVDASFLRQRVADTFSNNIGREVRFDGPMEMEISARPRLRVGGLHVSNPPGFSNDDFVSLGEARLAVDLWALLLNKQVRIDELAGSAVRIRLQSRADGSNNWTLPRRQQGSQRRPASERSPALRADQAVVLLDVGRVSLEQLNVEYVSAEQTSHFFDLHTLEATSPANQPMKMVLKGAVEREFPYEMQFTGGILSDLANDQPWPVAFTVNFLSSTLSVNGSVSGGGTGRFAFGLGTTDLEEFARLLQTDLPDVGASGIAATIDFSPRQVNIRQLAGAMGNTSLTGELAFDMRGDKPMLTGSLVAGTLDLRPFFSESPDSGKAFAQRVDERKSADSAPPRNLGELYRRLSTASFDLRRLNLANADVTLGVDRWLSLPGNIRDVRLRIKVIDGVLQAPLTATMTDVTLAGHAMADANATPPQFDLALGTSESDLGGLAELLLGVRGVQGHLGRFDLQLTSQGDQPSELVQSLDVRLNIERGRFSYGNVEGGRPVNFSLSQLALRLPPGEPLHADMRGTLLDRPFVGSVSASALEPLMLQASTPVDLQLRAGSARARVKGTLELPDGDRGPDIRFEFSAPQAGDLANWFGLTPGAQAPATLTGKASLRETAWQVRDVKLALGRSELSAELSQRNVDGVPLLSLQLNSKQIDVAQLESMLPASKKAEPRRQSYSLDIPLLPQQINLADADIAVDIQRIAGLPLQVSDVSFDGRIRDGYMHPSPFAVSAAGADFSGAVLLDLRGAEPTAGVWLFAADIDVGDVLRKLGIARNLDAEFGDFAVNLVARSSRLGDMLRRSELIGEFGGGRIVLRAPNAAGEALITLNTGQLRADPEMPVRLKLDGMLDTVPVAIEVEAAPAHELADPKLPLHFTLKADTAGAHVRFSGKVARPVGTEVELALDARGGRFDELNTLARASLPPWGPWSAVGKFRISPLGYDVNELRLRVGDSVLTGTGRLETESGRPRIAIALNAPVIQLDDFKLGEWSPIEQKPQTDEKKLTAEEARRMAAEASDEAQRLLSPAMLRRQDVLLDVAVEQVLSGNDELGAGRMQARLQDGRADIGPIEVSVPGGVARISMGYEPSEQDVNVDLHIDVEKFDYGVLARRIKPQTDLAGSFSLKVDVDSRARYLSDILRHGTGRIDFAVWPQNMRSGVIDMWAVNVLVALASEVDPDKASKVNCAVGRFVLNDGLLNHETILLDTSRIRVTGQGSADFTREEFALRMRPQSKTAQFLSLATPIAVTGSFDNFQISVSPGDMVETFARLATSIIWVPLQKLTGKKLPADGADVCSAPLQPAPAQ